MRTEIITTGIFGNSTNTFYSKDSDFYKAYNNSNYMTVNSELFYADKKELYDEDGNLIHIEINSI